MKCTFCGNQIPSGTGKMFVFKDGRVRYYCSSKCERNDLKLKRKARGMKWTKRYVKGG
jgi:large subunit ribosomal protein L24e